MIEPETELPHGWTRTALDDVVDVLDYLRQPVSAAERAKRAAIYPYFGANGQAGMIDDYLIDGDHILVAEDGGYFDEPSRGVAYRVLGKAWVNNHAHILRARAGVSTDFLLYALNATDWLRYVSGTTRLKLTQARLREVRLPLPPGAEQRRIVAKLDELLASSRAARVALDAVPALLEQYRQAALATAFRELLDGTCAIHPLESLIPPGRTITYGIVQTGTPTMGGVPTVRCGDIKRFSVAVDALKRVDPGIESQYPRTRLRGGEVLLAIRGSVGEVAVAPPALTGANVSREVAVIPAREDVEPEYLMYLLASPVVAAAINGQVKGVAQSGINIGDLRRIEVPLPSPEHQVNVVRAIRDALASIDRLADRVVSSRSDLHVLEQATLAKAFRGELVPQAPADEPAATLLERLGSERAAVPRGRRHSALVDPSA